MNKKIKKTLSTIFSKIWLKRNKKTVELDAQECRNAVRYILVSKLVIKFSILAFICFLAYGISGKKVEGNEEIILAAVILSLIFNAAAVKIHNHFHSAIGGAGKRLATDWKNFHKKYNALGIKISTTSEEPLDLESLREKVVKILTIRAREIYALEQLELESERSKLRPTMDKIIDLFEENFGLTFGKAGNYFPEDSKSRNEEQDEERQPQGNDVRKPCKVWSHPY